MWRAAFLPWPTAIVTVRSDGTMSPPAKMPGWPVIMSGVTATTPPLTMSPGTPSSSERSTSWPSASTSESASSVSNSPVGCGNPSASSAIFSTVSEPPSMRLIVDSHLIITPSSSASATSKSCAGIFSRVRRYTMMASDAPSLFAVRAASIAVLPPPYTTTRRPSIGMLSPSIERSIDTASTTRAAVPAGMYARFAMCAPTARNAASKPPSRIVPRMSLTLVSSRMSTPISTIRWISASRMARGRR